jgi:uncharacterized protein with von Willebrand factor type A (vWA) domain
LLALVEDLRRNGVRVSQDESSDAARAWKALGDLAVVERATLEAVLATTLVKRAEDAEVFRRLFALHFHFGDGGPPVLAASMVDKLVERGLSRADAEAIVAALAQEAGSAGQGLALGDEELVRAALHAALERTDLAGLQTSLQIGYFTQRLFMQTGGHDLERVMASTLQGLDDDAERIAAGVFQEGLEQLRRLARRAVEREHQKKNLARGDRLRERALLEQRFGQLRSEDLARMRILVKQLAWRLKERMQVRRKRARQGRIDVRRTLRASVAFDGMPMRVRWQKKRRERPDVVVLCDVSDSVRSASLFMLELVHALAELFRRVRCFVFVDALGEVTELFRTSSPEEAVDRVLAGDVVNVSTNSDYGRALRQFHDEHLSALTRRTTIVVLGDGRSNYRPAEAWTLGEMRRRAKRTLWLCPEERGTWGFGDSEMITYARQVDVVEVVRNLHELSRTIDRLVIR